MNFLENFNDVHQVMLNIIFLFKVENVNTWTMCDIFTKLTINNKDDVMVSWLNLKDLTHFCGVSIVDYKKLNAGLDEGQHNLTPKSEF